MKLASWQSSSKILTNIGLSYIIMNDLKIPKLSKEIKKKKKNIQFSNSGIQKIIIIYVEFEGHMMFRKGQNG